MCRAGASPGRRDALLEAALAHDVALALALARARAERDARPSELAWTLLGLRGEAADRALITAAIVREGPRGALPAALALAAGHRALDDAWRAAEVLAVSNALREAAYVVLGGEAPPVVLRDSTPEEPEVRAQRYTEDTRLAAAMHDVVEGHWRWGALGAIDERAESLGPKHLRWARAAARVCGDLRTRGWDELDARFTEEDVWRSANRLV